MRLLYILKIGGSVATCKNRSGASIRKSLLKKTALSISEAKKAKDFSLIIIHGAGAAGHQLAKKYALEDGTRNDPKKWYGALISRIANNNLNNAITEIFTENGLQITPVHTASVIIQKNKKIYNFNTETIEESLRQNCIPILYGEMVFDKSLGMSICSGDAIAPYLCKKFNANKMFFASDIDGVFTQDPHIHKNAKLIQKINLNEIRKKADISKSHNIDTTGGLLGKIKNIEKISGTSLKSIEIFNGLNSENYKNVFLENKFFHTKIILK